MNQTPTISYPPLEKQSEDLYHMVPFTATPFTSNPLQMPSMWLILLRNCAPTKILRTMNQNLGFNSCTAPLCHPISLEVKAY